MNFVSAIIVAGGSGRRMGADIRKQYLEIGGSPIISRTILAIDACPAIKNIYLVIPEEDHLFCQESILSSIHVRSFIKLVSGGKIRQESVHNGLSAIDTHDGIVLIHDGVRPFIAVDQINNCIKGAERFGACILGVPVSDTLKHTDAQGDIAKTVDRNFMWLAQTPQAFQYQLIKKAHDYAVLNGFQGTDDASLVEQVGERVRMIPGSVFNIKITTPEDFLIAQAWVRISDSQIV
jgi:2-C-methyl-D-erythritol 4-phosphate cytidylyltransferase